VNPSLERLEFDRLLSIVAGHAGGAAGRRLVMSVLPAGDGDLLRECTLAAAGFLASGAVFDGRAVDALEAVIEPLDSGAVILEPGTLRALGEALAGLAAYRAALDAGCGDWRSTAAASAVSGLPVLPELSRHLLRITTPSGDLADDASEKLSRLMRTAARIRDSISRDLARLSERFSTSGASRDIPPTIRNGRYVLPVNVRSRSAVAGIVHDRSDTGGTLFIEPAELVGQGNSLQECLLEVQQERRRILREATAMVRAERAPLVAAIDAGAGMDAMQARARWHIERGTVFPGEGPLSLTGARHPLIPASEVVPNDIELPADWRVLVVSGPNAGGKTVLLKTVGLAACCARTGLGVIAEPGSTMPVFERILVSIGDRQSLQDRLSTFSARLGEEMEMLESAGPDTLVLVDEPAGGTDPLPGAALAAVFLEELAARGARVVATTHLGQLKTMASGRAGFYNGSMNFDEQRLEPDYTFRFGLPGSSFTLEIAGRMGFPGDLLERAELLSGDAFRLDRLVSELQSRVDEAARETGRALELQGECETLASVLEDRIRGEEARAAGERRQARERLEALVREINSRADALMQRISSPAREDRAEARRRVRELSGLLPGPEPEELETAAEGSVGPGDRVSVRGWGGAGVVEELRGDSVLVRFGAVMLERPRAEVSPTGEPPQRTREATPEYELAPPSPELDVRGGSSEDALAMLDSRLDECAAAGVGRLRIIHGKGRGILMKSVVDYLRRDRRVASFGMAEPSEGGAGATVAILKTPGRS
jgi:DNA mismatch repair protein MutS2